MLYLIPIDRKPLENVKGHVYSRMAFDGICFYCCTGKSKNIFKLNREGKLQNCISTKRAYCSICFDCNENCFWAITSACPNFIFKLNKDWCEIACINFLGKDLLFHNISYDIQGDILLLCSEDMVRRVSKSGVIIPLYSEEQGVQHKAAAQIFDSHLIACKFQTGGPDIIGIFSPNNCFEYLCCMPRQFSLNSICVCYGYGNGDELFVLGIQNYKYPYLLTYSVEHSEKIQKCCPPTCYKTFDDDPIICVSIDSMDVQTDIII